MYRRENIYSLHHISSSARRYSPTSAWWNTTIAFGSAARHSPVDLAVTPNPNGTSLIEYTTTPVYPGVFSVILPSPAFAMWFPYNQLISADGLTHTCRFVNNHIHGNNNSEWPANHDHCIHDTTAIARSIHQSHPPEPSTRAIHQSHPPEPSTIRQSKCWILILALLMRRTSLGLKTEEVFDIIRMGSSPAPPHDNNDNNNDNNDNNDNNNDNNDNNDNNNKYYYYYYSTTTTTTTRIHTIKQNA